MSIRYVAAVLDALPGLSASETLVLVALADFASDDTLECWPSLATISRRARCNRRTAQRILRRLELAGLIEVNRGGHQYGVNTSSSYRLRFDHQGTRLEGPAAPRPELSTRAAPRRPGAAPATGKGGAGDRQGRSYAAPSVIEPSLNQRASNRRSEKRGAVDNPAGISKAEAPRALANLLGELERRGSA